MIAILRRLILKEKTNFEISAMDKNWHNQHFNHSTASQSSQGYCDACIIALY